MFKKLKDKIVDTSNSNKKSPETSISRQSSVSSLVLLDPQKNTANDLSSRGINDSVNDCNKSQEVPDDSISLQSEPSTLSQQELFNRFQKMQELARKYKTRFYELHEAYKSVQGELEKVRSIMGDSQDKTLRRINELREQIQLDQQAKRDIEENYRVLLEDRDEQISCMKQQISLLRNKKEPGLPDSQPHSDNEASEIISLKDSVKKREELLKKCKERIHSLTQERNNLLQELETSRFCNSSKNEESNEPMQMESSVNFTLQEELETARQELQTLQTIMDSRLADHEVQKLEDIQKINEQLNQEWKVKLRQAAQMNEEYQTVIEEKNKMILSLHSNLEELTHKLTSLETNNNELLEEKNVQRANFENLLTELNIRMTEKNSSITALEEKQKSLEAIIEASRQLILQHGVNERGKLDSDTDDSDLKVIDFTHQLATLSTVITSLKEEVESAKLDREMFMEKNQSLAEVNQPTLAFENDSLLKISELQQENVSLIDRVEELQLNVHEAEKALLSVRNENIILTNRLGEMQNEVESLKQVSLTVTSLENELGNITPRLHCLESDISTLRKKLEIENSEKARANDELQHKNELIEQMKKEIDQLQQDIVTRENSLLSNVDNLLKELAQLHEDRYQLIREHENALKVLLAKTGDLESQLDVANETIDHVEKKNAESEHQIQDLNNKYNELLHQHTETLSEESQRSMSQLHETNVSLETLKSENIALQTQVSTLLSEMEQVKVEYDQIQSQFSSKCLELETMCKVNGDFASEFQLTVDKLQSRVQELENELLTSAVTIDQGKQDLMKQEDEIHKLMEERNKYEPAYAFMEEVLKKYGTFEAGFGEFVRLEEFHCKAQIEEENWKKETESLKVQLIELGEQKSQFELDRNVKLSTLEETMLKLEEERSTSEKSLLCRINELETHLYGVSQTLVESQEELVLKIQLCETFQIQLDGLKSSCCEAQETVQHQSQIIDDLTGKLQQTVNELQTLTLQVSQMEDSKMLILEENNTMKLQLDQANEEVKALGLRNEDLFLQCTKLQTENSLLQENGDSISISLETSKIELEKDLHHWKEKFDLLQNERETSEQILQSQIANLQGQLSEVANDLASIQDEMFIKTKHCETLQSQLESLQSSTCIAEEGLQQKSQTIRCLDEELDHWKEKYGQLQNERGTLKQVLQSEIAGLQSQLSVVTNDLANVQEELSIKTQHCQALQNQLESLQSSFCTVEEDLQQKAEAMKNLDEELLKASREINALTVQLAEKENVMTLMLKEKSDITNQWNQDKEELEALQLKNEVLFAQCTKLQTENVLLQENGKNISTSLKANKEELKKELHHWREKHDLLQNERVTLEQVLRSQIADLEGQANVVTNALANVQEEMLIKTQHCETLQSQLESLQSSASIVKESLQQKEETIKNLDEELHQWKNKLDLLQNERVTSEQVLLSQIADLQGQLSRVTNDLANIQDEMSIKTNHCETLQSQLESLQSSTCTVEEGLQQKMDAVEKLTEELNKNVIEINALTIKIGEKEDVIKHISEENIDLTARLHQIQEEVETFQLRNEDLLSQNTTLQSANALLLDNGETASNLLKADKEELHKELHVWQEKCNQMVAAQEKLQIDFEGKCKQTMEQVVAVTEEKNSALCEISKLNATIAEFTPKMQLLDAAHKSNSENYEKSLKESTEKLHAVEKAKEEESTQWKLICDAVTRELRQVLQTCASICETIPEMEKSNYDFLWQHSLEYEAGGNFSFQQNSLHSFTAHLVSFKTCLDTYLHSLSNDNHRLVDRNIFLEREIELLQAEKENLTHKLKEHFTVNDGSSLVLAVDQLLSRVAESRDAQDLLVEKSHMAEQLQQLSHSHESQSKTIEKLNEQCSHLQETNQKQQSFIEHWKNSHSKLEESMRAQEQGHLKMVHKTIADLKQDYESQLALKDEHYLKQIEMSEQQFQKQKFECSQQLEDLAEENKRVIKLQEEINILVEKLQNELGVNNQLQLKIKELENQIALLQPSMRDCSMNTDLDSTPFHDINQLASSFHTTEAVSPTKSNYPFPFFMDSQPDTVTLQEFEILQMNNLDLQNQLTQLSQEMQDLRAQLNQKPSDAFTRSQHSLGETSHSILDSQHYSSDEASSFYHRPIALSDAAEYEYLKNVMFEYMVGRERRTLAKVLCTVLRFSMDQTKLVMRHEGVSDVSWMTSNKARMTLNSQPSLYK